MALEEVALVTFQEECEVSLGLFHEVQVQWQLQGTQGTCHSQGLAFLLE